MTTLPEKPDAVAHVSDALWEAALSAADAGWPQHLQARVIHKVTDHARCLILLGEMVEPKSDVDNALDVIWHEWDCGYQDRSTLETLCRKHFAGLIFPVIGQ